MYDHTRHILTSVLALASGAIVGAFGVGGVVLVPCLFVLYSGTDIEAHQLLFSTFCAMILPTALVSLQLFKTKREVITKNAPLFSGSAVGGSLAGVLVPLISDLSLRIVIGSCIAVVGVMSIHSLFKEVMMRRLSRLQNKQTAADAAFRVAGLSVVPEAVLGVVNPQTESIEIERTIPSHRNDVSIAIRDTIISSMNIVSHKEGYVNELHDTPLRAWVYRAKAIGVGIAVGLGSGFSGTGGAVMGIPALRSFLNYGVDQAVLCAQPLALFITTSITVAAVSVGSSPHLFLVVTLTAGLAVGNKLGAKLLIDGKLDKLLIESIVCTLMVAIVVLQAIEISQQIHNV